MHETVLMHADVDERAEGGHVGHHALEHHAGRKVRKGMHAFFKARGSEFRTRIAAGLFKFAQDVGHGRQTKLLVGVVRGVQLGKNGMVADEVVHRKTRLFDDARNDRIGLGVHARGVERVGRSGNAQKARGLLEGLGSETRHFQQLGARGKGPVGLAPAHDRLGLKTREARHAL